MNQRDTNEALRHAFVTNVLESDARLPKSQRRAAFDDADSLLEPLRTLVDKVAHESQHVTDADITAARASGATEDELFELIICAAVGEATRQHDAARAALAEALEGK